MATTQSPIVWDFVAQTNNNVGLGGIAHYFNGEDGQSIFLTNAGSLQTIVRTIQNGDWENAEASEIINITQNDDFNSLRLDHPSNGILYGVAANSDEVIFFRYVYMMDISEFMDSWKWSIQADNPISEFVAKIQNIDAEIFTEDRSLFIPGSKITASMSFGNSSEYKIGTAWLDECNYDMRSETVDISGRNTIGFFLKDQTFDIDYSDSKLSCEFFDYILNRARVPKYRTQTGSFTGTAQHRFTWTPETSFMDAVDEMCKYYTNEQKTVKIIELPDGTICAGYEVGFSDWLTQFQENSYYSFDEGREVFRRKTNRLCDGTYRYLRVTGTDENDEPLTPVKITIDTFDYWALGRHRTMHISAPKNMTQEELQSWAERQAEAYAYVGINENFTGPIRPQLLIGDIAEIIEGTQGTSLGLITEIIHSFSRQSGFATDFSVDSGGVETDGENYRIYSRIAQVNGYNRRQRIIDLVRLSKK